jgi:hypothetical protein
MAPILINYNLEMPLSGRCYFPLVSHTNLIAPLRTYCDMTPESRNSEVRIDVHC